MDPRANQRAILHGARSAILFYRTCWNLVRGEALWAPPRTLDRLTLKLLARKPGREFLSAAARRGVFAHLDSTDPTELSGAIDIAIERYRQFRDLLGAFDRRARIERAKGVLMERHGISGDEAFERLRRQARDTRRPIMGVVEDLLG